MRIVDPMQDSLLGSDPVFGVPDLDLLALVLCQPPMAYIHGRRYQRVAGPYL